VKDKSFQWQLIFVCLNILILLFFGFYFLGVDVNEKNSLIFYLVWIAMLCLNVAVIFQWFFSNGKGVEEIVSSPFIRLTEAQHFGIESATKHFDTFIAGTFYPDYVLQNGDVRVGETLSLRLLYEHHEKFPLIGFFSWKSRLLGYVPSKISKKVFRRMKKTGALFAKVTNVERVYQTLSVRVKVLLAGHK